MSLINRLIMSAVLAFSLPALALPTVEKPLDIIHTQSGELRGKVLNSGVKAWLGVPYAQAPVRERRWQAPQPISWQGVYNADRYAPQCIQPLRASNINHYFGHEATSEDCLYMNIWAPAKVKKSEKLPVVVWIHGGGFTIGSPSMPNYGGENIVKKGVIYVSLAYRLGILGFLSHPDLTAQSPYKASGNYGLLDQVAALQWLQKNIASFGGDPQRVIIMGQSAGSASVSYLQVSPLSQDLFSGIVGMSGSAFMRPMSTRVEAEATGLALQQAFNASSIDELKHVSADRILKSQLDCQLGCSGEFRVGPIIDGYFLTESPIATFENRREHDVPVLIGFTKDEGFSGIGQASNRQQLQQAVNQTYGENAQSLLSLYPAETDEDAQSVAKQIARDSTLGMSMWQWGKYQQKYAKSPAYAYLFSRRHPYTQGVTFADHNANTAGVYHSADVPYWLQTLDTMNIFRQTRTYTSFDRNLANAMSDMIVSFAQTGVPHIANHTWPSLNSNQPELLELGSDEQNMVKKISWPNAQKIAFFVAHPAIPAPPKPATEMRSRD